MKMTKVELFEQLAQPNENGESRWVDVAEFIGDYSKLKLGNGGDWCRNNSILAKKYIVETDKSKKKGNSIDAIRLNGFNTIKTFSSHIRQDIKDFYKDKNCVMLGVKGKSENTNIEIDHKDGRKDDLRVANTKTQTLNDFQPLSRQQMT